MPVKALVWATVRTNPHPMSITVLYMSKDLFRLETSLQYHPGNNSVLISLGIDYSIVHMSKVAECN